MVPAMTRPNRGLHATSAVVHVVVVRLVRLCVLKKPASRLVQLGGVAVDFGLGGVDLDLACLDVVAELLDAHRFRDTFYHARYDGLNGFHRDRQAVGEPTAQV